MRARGELSSLQVMWDPCGRSPQHHRLWPSGSLSGSPLADSSTAFLHTLMAPANMGRGWRTSRRRLWHANILWHTITRSEAMCALYLTGLF